MAVLLNSSLIGGRVGTHRASTHRRDFFLTGVPFHPGLEVVRLNCESLWLFSICDI